MASGSVVRYQVDTTASQLTIQAFASGLISAVAHSPKIAIRDWEGTMQWDAAALSNSSLRVRIKAGSLEVLDELRDDDRRTIHRVMNQEVLETQQYPEIVYESTGAQGEKSREDSYRMRLRGELTLHGRSNPLSLEAQVAVSVDSIRAHGAFAIRQSDYDIQIASIAGGTMKLMNELKIYFWIVARLAQES